MIEINNILCIEQHLDDIEAAIFDLDDTLYSEKDYVKSGYRAIAALFPKVRNMTEKLWKVFERGGKAIDEVFALEGINDPENVEKAIHAYRFQVPDISLYDGVREMLYRLKDVKKIGIITDGRPEGQRAKIKALRLDEIADEIIITDELGGTAFRKPNEKAFVLMQSRLDIPYKCMAYVGDNIAKDFVAPQKLGMKSIWFRNADGLYV